MKYLLITAALTLSACAIHERPVECEWNQELIKDSVCINTRDDAQPKQNSGGGSSYMNSASGGSSGVADNTSTQTPEVNGNLRYGCNGNGCVSGSGRGRSEGNEKSKKDND